MSLLSLAEQNNQWREGPPLNENRGSHAAAACNGGVYVIGGWNGSSCLDSIERINVENLLTRSSAVYTRNQWTTLNCRLSTKKGKCSAAAIYNRYIVVLGGYRGKVNYFSSLDIIDTAVLSNHTVIVGPSMTVPRCSCASAVIGHRIFVVGGYNGKDLTSMEYLECHDPSDQETMNTANTVFPFSCRWTSHELELSVPRSDHAAVAVGSCLLVLGGYATNEEVLDTRRNTVWTIPRSTGLRYSCSAVVHSKGIAVIGGRRDSSCATLSLIDKNTWCFRRLTEQMRSTISGLRTNTPGLALKRATVLKESDEGPKKKLATGKTKTKKVLSEKYK